MTRAAPHKPRRIETGTDLRRVIVAPIIWSLHFLACYVWAAIHCEKAGRMADLDPARTGIFVLTGLALALIGFNTLRLWRIRARSLTDDDFDYEHDTPEERHRFLGHVALMLSVLSGVGVIYVAIPAILVETCR